MVLKPKSKIPKNENGGKHSLTGGAAPLAMECADAEDAADADEELEPPDRVTACWAWAWAWRLVLLLLFNFLSRLLFLRSL